MNEEELQAKIDSLKVASGQIRQSITELQAKLVALKAEDDFKAFVLSYENEGATSDTMALLSQLHLSMSRLRNSVEGIYG